jgi:hypothetical protein
MIIRGAIGLPYLGPSTVLVAGVACQNHINRCVARSRNPGNAAFASIVQMLHLFAWTPVQFVKDRISKISALK